MIHYLLSSTELFITGVDIELLKQLVNLEEELIRNTQSERTANLRKMY